MSAKSVLPSLVTILLLLSFGSASIIGVAADPLVRKVGVRVDNWGKYGEFKVTWNSNDTNARPDQELIDANKTDWIHISVYTITLMHVSFQETTHFTNGTEESTSKEVDVDIGWGTGALTFISADLSRNDSLYSSEEGASLKINETISRTYVGVLRQANVLNLTKSVTLDEPPQVVNMSVIYFWDKATGIITERQASAVNKTGCYVTSWSRSDRMIDTDLWDDVPAANDEPPYWIIGTITLFLIVIGGLGVWLPRRARSKVHRSPRRRRSTNFYMLCLRASGCVNPLARHTTCIGNYTRTCNNVQ